MSDQGRAAAAARRITDKLMRVCDFCEMDGARRLRNQTLVESLKAGKLIHQRGEWNPVPFEDVLSHREWLDLKADWRLATPFLHPDDAKIIDILLEMGRRQGQALNRVIERFAEDLPPEERQAWVLNPDHRELLQTALEDARGNSGDKWIEKLATTWQRVANELTASPTHQNADAVSEVASDKKSPPTLDEATAPLSLKQRQLVEFLWDSPRPTKFQNIWRHAGVWDIAKDLSEDAIEKMAKRTREKWIAAGGKLNVLTIEISLSGETLFLTRPDRC